ncbi:hypothetical protein C7999DRAFT_35598 [Corynascus novoguineensis]|uniref:Aflatoxin regulatory protein domain-containing protein n=1 Tax=Corynascus novoguineensis TaxID=1126955 RepID=A0AAN7CLN4_9PEZI|nr:hypothetical protein C7999DRAFT_35598 [Corynascus novoguineensis]
MEWSLYPELAQTLGTSSQCSFDFSLTGNMGTSPGDADEAGLNFGTGDAGISESCADTEAPYLSDVLTWEAWDLGGSSSGASNSTIAATTPPPDTGATLLALAENDDSIISSRNSGNRDNCGRGRSGRSGRSTSSKSPSAAACTTRHCSSPTKSCIAAAASAISALHVCTDMCLSSPSSSPFSSPLSTMSSASPSINPDHLHRRVLGLRTIDTILTDGRDAARTISATLNCSACSSMPQLHLLAATALEKLASWYRVVVEGMLQRPPSTSPPSTTTAAAGTVLPPTSSSALRMTPPRVTSTGSAAGVDAESVVEDANMHHYLIHGSLPLTIAIGTHAVEEALQAAVVAQVVMQRLRELKCMVELLARRMGGGAEDGPDSTGRARGSNGEDGRLPPAVRDKLVGRVRQRLVTTWEELAVLRDEQLRCGLEESL